ncbi:MAG: serine/threonine protein kinase [Candidatus Sumerlaeaceae bacterium]|nr:serine/threonine protein kinase [Candidatus Sumerlaeaceae bacterium]
MARRATPDASGSEDAVEQCTPSGGGEASAPLPSGMMLGGFQIQKFLGKGGMAAVYRGIQISLNRPVAIKVLSPRYARDPNLVRRFEREAGALAGLSHPNIVNIIERGEAGGYHYIVLELVEGVTLNHVLHTAELKERHFLRVIEEVGSALAYIHSLGIVHRDVKPSNILVNRQGVVKLSDFGIVLAGEEPEVPSRGSTVGTASYMAPEQRRDPNSVDARADIYSLGVTFYKMFTRQLPGDPYVPPSQLNPSLPPAVDAIVARALQTNPDDRPSSVREFCDDLRRAFEAGREAVGAEAADSPAVVSPLVQMLDSGAERSGAAETGATLDGSAVERGSPVGAAQPSAPVPTVPAHQWLLALVAVGVTVVLITLVLLALRWA